jgi:diguanylate cyclase (GGDEF)-like protein/PAS domain S-box-containing protein
MSFPPELENAILRNLLAQTTRAYEDQVHALDAEKELAQTTLAAIADGVIATDAGERVIFLNPVAEKLTGWRADEARGRPLAEVFRLVSETSGEPIEVPGGDRGRGDHLRLADRTSLIRRDGARFAVESAFSPVGDRAGGPLGAVIVFQDVSEERLLALHLAHQATHDALTDLLNRQAFDLRLRRALGEARTRGHDQALAYMDLDQFKVVNDTCGHFAGDELLRQVAALVQEAVGDRGVLARLGGDEFGLLVPHGVAAAHGLVGEIHRAVQEFRFVWQEKTFAVGVSIGLVPVGRQFETVAGLMSAADHACYVAKEKGRNRIQVFQPDEAEFVRRYGEMDWVVRIQHTLEQERFRLWAQPIQALRPDAGRGLSFEVLLRMEDDEGRLHHSGDFIRAAERYGLMPGIDRWVLGATFDFLAARSPAAAERLALVWINLSAVSLGDESFLAFVRERLAASPLPAAKICFEITETAAVANLPQAQRLIRELAGRGCRFALDDFGRGMSSYGYLKDLAVDFLKIDGSFVQDIVSDRVDRAMVESIQRLGSLLGIATVAESVSSEAAADLLREIGIDYAQGHWIGPPRPLAEVAGG